MWSFLADLNLSILHGFCDSNTYLYKMAGHLDETGLKGLLYMAVFGTLWFRESSSENKTK
jgi:hypothetical protein